MFPTRRITTMGGDKFRDEYSLAFDGTNDYIATGFVPNYTNITVSTWLKVSLDANLKAICSARDSANDGFLFYISADEAPVIKLNGTSITGNTLVADVWTHVAFTWDGSIIKLYQNGELRNNTSESSVMNISKTMEIGGESSTTAANYYYYGNISEVAVYNTQLNNGQIMTLYNGREPYNHKEGIASGNLQGWWRMGDGRLDSRHLVETDTQVISDEVTPTIGSTLWDSPASVFTSGTYSWEEYADSTISNDSNTLKIVKDAHDSTQDGAYLYLKNASDLSSDLTVGKVYKIKFDAKVNTGTIQYQVVTGTAGTDNLTWELSNTSFQTIEGYFVAGHATDAYLRTKNMVTGQIAWFDNISLQEVGGNAGVMQNMDAVSFKGDTP